MAGLSLANPLKQFDIKTLVPLDIMGVDVSLTNATLWMFFATGLLCLFGFLATFKQSLVPSRIGYLFEWVYDFIQDLVVQQVGKEGLRYFNYIFCLFLFVLVLNLAGMLPYSFTVTSHISATFAIAFFVFMATIVVGLYHHKGKFFRLFCPDDLPIYIMPILVPIEILSFLARPFSLAIRLCANMVAGHVMIKIFAGFVGIFLNSSWMVLGILPLMVNVGLTAFEIGICGLQAYIFTVLTCIYLNDTLHLH